MSRFILLVPKHVIDTLCHPCNTIDNILELCGDNKIPTITIVERDNFFTGVIDRCCPCDCKGRISRFKIEKQDIDEFIQNQLEKCVKVLDS
jgi:hypothetical protein